MSVSVVRSDVISLVTPTTRKVVLYANPESKTIDQVDVDAYAVYKQRWSDGTSSQVALAVTLEPEGFFCPVHESDMFIGVLDRLEIDTNGIPEWANEIALEIFEECHGREEMN